MTPTPSTPPSPPTPSGAVITRLLVVDDEALVRFGFRLILEAEDDFEVVGEAADGVEAIEQARRLAPDVVLIDIRMPRLDGVEATRQLAADGHKVLVLTTFDLDEYLFNAVKAGASGFLLKDVPPDDLAAAVRAVARGDALVEPRMTKRLLEEFSRAAPRSSSAGPTLDQLTEREVEVLREVAKGSTNAEIGEALFISETTVKTHVAHILTKLGLRDRVQAVVVAYESGLVPPGSS
ncbi:MAG TPA: response regulator transcription factor [Acidimicrobiales bacterium]|nr:response regulator transcription factor [Acidimicrobiales bacterium]